MTILPYDESMKNALIQMLAAYFPEVDAGIPEQIIRGKLFQLIQDQWSRGYLHIRIGFSGREAIGFSIFQIDSPHSDWCKRPGWGFVREFYIRPEFRRAGFGRQLADHTVEALRAMGPEGLYLTAGGEAISFWSRCGWESTGGLCSNDLFILEKRS